MISKEQLQYKLKKSDMTTTCFLTFMNVIKSLVKRESVDEIYLEGVDEYQIKEMWRLPCLPEIKEMGGFQLLVFKRDIVNDYCFEGVKKIFLNVLLKHYDTPYSNILKRAVQSEESWSEPSRFSFNKDERSEEEKQKVATIIESWVRESFEQAKLSLGFNVDGVNWEYQLTNDSRKIKLLYFKNQGNTVEITINLAFDNKSMTNKVLMKTRTSFKRKFKHQTELKLVGSMKDKFMLNEILPFAAKVIISLGEGSLQTEKEQLAVLIGNWSFDSLDKNDAVK